MRRMLPVVAVIALIGVACGPGAPAGMDAARAEVVDASVRALLNSVARDLADQGPNGWLAHFVDDGTFFMANEGELVFPDLATATEAVQLFDPTIGRMEIAWDDARVTPLTTTSAAVAASYRELLVDTDGAEIRLAGYVTMLAVETPTGWRLQHLHWSAAPPASDDGGGDIAGPA